MHAGRQPFAEKHRLRGLHRRQHDVATLDGLTGAQAAHSGSVSFEAGLANRKSVLGVEHDVPRELEEVRVALDKNAAEATVEEMAFVTVAPVEPLGVDTVQPLHTGRNISMRCLEEKVEVIRHQAIAMAPPFVALDHVLEDLLEPEAIACVGENVGLADAA